MININVVFDNEEATLLKEQKVKYKTWRNLILTAVKELKEKQ